MVTTIGSDDSIQNQFIATLYMTYSNNLSFLRLDLFTFSLNCLLIYLYKDEKVFYIVLCYNTSMT